MTKLPSEHGATVATEYLADIETVRYWLQAHMRDFRFHHNERDAEAILDKLKGFIEHCAAQEAQRQKEATK